MSAPQKSVLSAKDMHCGIAGHTIVNRINLSFDAEPMTVIIGVSDAGKSTLLHTLGGITRPAAGEVEINGKSMSSTSSRHRVRDLTFVAQDGVPPAEMRVCDFVSLGRLPYQRLLSDSATEDSSRVDRALTLVGLETIAQRLCGQLSGGQRRRVCLTRAIAQDSPIMFLDEPTNHLDVHHQQSILRPARSSGACIIAVTHDLNLVMDHFDRVIVVADGGIVTDGIPVDVLTRDFVAKIFQVESCQLNSPSGHRRLAIGNELDAVTIS